MTTPGRATTPPCGFTYAHYAETLRAARDTYRFLLFPEAEAAAVAGERFVLLRHDIDFAVEEAVPLAEAEAALGIRATYFVLPHGPYNLLGPPACAAVERILSLGHALGLHYDVALYAGPGGDQALGREAAALGARFAVDIAVVAEHNPGLAPRPLQLDLGRRLDAYAPAFTATIKYLSDSCQHWREGCFCGHLGPDGPPRLQVLTHPLWWSAEGRPADEAIFALTRRRVAWAEADERRIFRHYGSLAHLANRELFRKHT